MLRPQEEDLGRKEATSLTSVVQVLYWVLDYKQK